MSEQLVVLVGVSQDGKLMVPDDQLRAILAESREQAEEIASEHEHAMIDVLHPPE